MKRRAQVRAVRLLHDDHIDGSSEGGTVDFAVELLEVAEHFHQTIHRDVGCALLVHGVRMDGGGWWTTV